MSYSKPLQFVTPLEGVKFVCVGTVDNVPAGLIFHFSC